MTIQKQLPSSQSSGPGGLTPQSSGRAQPFEIIDIDSDDDVEEIPAPSQQEDELVSIGYFSRIPVVWID